MVRGGGGSRNMKYKGPPMAAIFFMTSFNRTGTGGHCKKHEIEANGFGGNFL